MFKVALAHAENCRRPWVGIEEVTVNPSFAKQNSKIEGRE